MDCLGCTYDPAAGGLYVWGRVPCAKTAPGAHGAAVPGGSPAEAWSDRILYGAGVFLTPGFIFGSGGENHLRISLCADVPTLERALEKIAVFINAGKSDI